MNDETNSPLGPLDRLASAVEFFASLDRRLASAFDALDEMRRQMHDLQTLGTRGDELVADVRRRVEGFDRRVNQDLSELKAAGLAKLEELDIKGLGARLDRIEVAIYNIEKATVSLNKTMSGSVEALPGFMTRKIRAEEERVQPDSPES